MGEIRKFFEISDFHILSQLSMKSAKLYIFKGTARTRIVQNFSRIYCKVLKNSSTEIAEISVIPKCRCNPKVEVSNFI